MRSPWTKSILDNLAGRGWVFVDAALPADLCRNLRQCGMDLQKTGKMKPAKIGPGLSRQKNSLIRDDEIYWLQDQETQAALKLWLQFLIQLQQDLNQELFLGAGRFECHFACYPPGGHYDRHVDQSTAGPQDRLISFVYYLNNNWKPRDGGQLVIYKDHESSEIEAQIEPHEGRLVLFQSAKVSHAVAKSTSERWSLTGWLRKNPLF